MELVRVVQKLRDYQVVLEPDENLPEWWAGAPSVAACDGLFHLACRMREGRSRRGRRGYEIRLLSGTDGIHFRKVGGVNREEAGVTVFERPCLIRMPDSCRFRLYGCAGFDDGWAILAFDDVDDPSKIDPRSWRKVLVAESGQSEFAHVTGYKDPVVFVEGDEWHLFVIGSDRVERIHHFLSGDGLNWQPAPGGSVLENTGWHSFFTRPASILSLAVGYLFVYEGSHISWRDPVYNIATGLAYSPDLKKYYDLTPDQPLLKSVTPGDYHTWRYSHWLRHDDKIFVYWEAARPNGTNELRVSVFSEHEIIPPLPIR